MERQLATGVVNDSSAPAAQHLENLYDSISADGFTKLKPDQQAEMLRLRRSLAQYITKGSAPPDSEDFINKAGDLQTAADMLRQPGVQARARWNALSGGKYETIAGQLEKLDGKVDMESVAKRADLERELRGLVADPKFMGSASPQRQAIYRTMGQQANVVEDAGVVFDKSYKGADRTGDFDPSALQRNWKGYVNKYGVAQVKDALGEERFNSMNDFVNQIAAEPAQDKAMQAAQDALFDSAVNGWKTRVDAIKASDKAVSDAQEAKFNEATDNWKAEKAKAAEFDKTAKADQTAAWKQAKAKQAGDYKAASDEYQAGVDARNAERQKLIDDRNAEYQRKVADYKQNKQAASDLNAEQKAQIDEAHAQNLADWKAETKQIKNLNMADFKEYKKMQAAQDALNETNQDRAKGLLSNIRTGNRKLDAILAMTAATLPVEVLVQAASHGFGKQALIATGAGLTGWLLKRIITNPTTGRLALAAIREGGDPQIYGPAIGELLKHTTTEPAQPEPQR
jgi:hypothetical protein